VQLEIFDLQDVQMAALGQKFANFLANVWNKRNLKPALANTKFSLF